MTETHCNNDDIPTLDGFKVMLQNRPKNPKAWRASGGIAVLVKNDIHNGVKLMESVCSEILWVKIDKTFFTLEDDLYIAIVYVSPHNSSYTAKREDIFTLLEQSFAKYSDLGKCMVMGDFNARTSNLNDFVSSDCLKYVLPNAHDTYVKDTPLPRCNQDLHNVDKHGEYLLDLCKSTGLRILNGRAIGDTKGHFTCFSPCGNPSVIDYILVDHFIMNMMQTMRVNNLTPFSIHCKLSVNIRLPFQHKCTVSKLIPMSYTKIIKWSRVNDQAFRINAVKPDIIKRALEISEKEYSYDTEGINTLTNDIQELLKTIRVNAHITPKGTMRRGNNNKGKKTRRAWYDISCNNMYKELKQMAHNLSCNPKNHHLHQAYFSTKRKYKYLLKRKKRSYNSMMLNMLSNTESRDPQSFWKTFNEIKKLNHLDHSRENPIPPTEWYEHFSKLFQHPKNSDTDEDITQFVERHKNDYFNELNVKVNESEVRKAITLLKNKKACGHDGIPNEMIKAWTSSPVHIKLLCKHINHILTSGVFPDQWRPTLLTPVFKKGDKHNPQNYRGIAVGSSLGKVLCIIMNTRLNSFLDNNKVIPPHQIGFRKGQQTVDHILTLKTIIDKYCHKLGKKLYCCFIDFKKAYDNVWREGLFYKMIQNEIGGCFLNLIRNMYNNVPYMVKSNDGGLTPPIESESGLKQGCVLSPTLFNLFIHDIPTIFNDNCKPVELAGMPVNCLLYADDLVIISQESEGLQQALNALDKYGQKWHLEINISKSKIMIFNKKGKYIKPSRQFCVRNNNIENVKTFTYLGIILKTNGAFDDTVLNSKDKAIKAMYSLVKSLGETNAETSLKLFSAMVLPIINYGATVWSSHYFEKLTPYNLYKIVEKPATEKVSLRFAKTILGVPPKTTNAGVRGELGLFPILVVQSSYLVRYWKRLLHMPQESLVYQALDECRTLRDGGNKNWLDGVYNCINLYSDKFNVDINMDDPGNNLDVLISNFYKQWYSETWLSDINRTEDNKLRFYNKFKKTFQMEQYLLSVNNKLSRKALTRLRTSAHSLEIETGRYHKPKKLEIEERICKLCKLETEDEKHFLLYCTAYDVHRTKFLNDICDIIPSFLTMLPDEKLIFIMSSYEYDVLKLVINFITTCLNHRATVLQNLEVVP